MEDTAPTDVEEVLPPIQFLKENNIYEGGATVERTKVSDGKKQKWEDTIEGVVYNLGTIGDASYEDDNNKILIAEVLLKLPKIIRDKVLLEAMFLLLESTGIVEALYIPVPKDCKMIEQPLIMLNFTSMKNKSKSRKMDCIAHEIAHFMLDHYKPDKRGNPKNEREADDLTEKWGFKRAYKEQDYPKLPSKK